MENKYKRLCVEPTVRMPWRIDKAIFGISNSSFSAGRFRPASNFVSSTTVDRDPARRPTPCRRYTLCTVFVLFFCNTVTVRSREARANDRPRGGFSYENTRAYLTQPSLENRSRCFRSGRRTQREKRTGTCFCRYRDRSTTGSYYYIKRAYVSGAKFFSFFFRES